jgi:hypothetical protein
VKRSDLARRERHEVAYSWLANIKRISSMVGSMLFFGTG